MPNLTLNINEFSQQTAPILGCSRLEKGIIKLIPKCLLVSFGLYSTVDNIILLAPEFPFSGIFVWYILILKHKMAICLV